MSGSDSGSLSTLFSLLSLTLTLAHLISTTAYYYYLLLLYYYLYSINSRFELAELAPYVADLVTGKVGAKSVAELLLANARLVDKIYYMEE